MAPSYDIMLFRRLSEKSSPCDSFSVTRTLRNFDPSGLCSASVFLAGDASGAGVCSFPVSWIVWASTSSWFSPTLRSILLDWNWGDGDESSWTLG